MENFKNETLDLTSLPKFEEVQFNLLHENYWKVCLVGMAVGFLVLGVATGMMLSYAQETFPFRWQIISGVVTLMFIILFFSRMSFRKKAYAFRNHDVLFRYGIISTNTIIIPYNRVQHVALHEGLISRYFDLAELQIFTAGGKESDIMIPGVEKILAENIKQLLMGKIQKQL